MCMQCVATASVAAGATATGLRAWLNARRPSWINPSRMKKFTAGLLLLAVVASGMVAMPSSAVPADPAATSHNPADRPGK